MKFSIHKKKLHIITILYIVTFLFINVQIYKMNIKHFSVMTILRIFEFGYLSCTESV